ncbi:dihydrodipicolinate synthase family protein [Paenibacillus sp. J5C_2022]|uniref:dihydrodipicolinate synthase family protein n=1 Tax=Paenibacillus sp. J5C2022 TaxID=2977129 RepID=UPI0021D31FE9|nr:dihydrodipicolinate synthase family protein [Paenibacillus sp. J5C2022]MCU6712944.1 dihydrodipicolinate synthase family protein [Paenibacillus sp. J5C2022]
MIKNKLQGMICPMITPLGDREQIDEAAVRHLVCRLVDRGADGIFLLGSMGEFPVIEEEERRRLIEIAVDEAKGKIPVMANVSAEGLRKTERNLRGALDAGADAVVLVAPYFYTLRNERELRDYFLEVSRNSSKPLIMYNIPKYTNNPLSVPLIAELSEESNIIGIKTDIFIDVTLMRRLAGRHDFSVLHGNEATLDLALKLGADGYVPGISTLAIDRCVELLRRWRQGDAAGAALLQTELIAVQRTVYGDNAEHWGTGHKYALSLLGLCQTHVATTLPPLSERQKEVIASALRQYRIA